MIHSVLFVSVKRQEKWQKIGKKTSSNEKNFEMEKTSQGFY